LDIILEQVPCGNGQWGFGRRKRSVSGPIPSDPNKVLELEWTTVLRVDHSPDNWHYINVKKESMESRFENQRTGRQVKANETKSNQVKRQAFTQNQFNGTSLLNPINSMIVL
ncbi:unnamed protein product, partial [Oppiella nova]